MSIDNDISAAAKITQTEHCQKICLEMQNNDDDQKTFRNVDRFEMIYKCRNDARGVNFETRHRASLGRLKKNNMSMTLKSMIFKGSNAI